MVFTKIKKCLPHPVTSYDTTSYVVYLIPFPLIITAASPLPDLKQNKLNKIHYFGKEKSMLLLK